MRAREFLLEYNRQKTADSIGPALIAALANDRSVTLPNFLTTLRQKVKGLSMTGSQRIDAVITPENQKAMINNILAGIEDRDPSPNKQYSQWLARTYARGGVSMEDLNRFDLLGAYDTAKKRRMIKPEHADINRFKFYQDFEDAMEANYNNFEDLDAEQRPEGKATKVYEDGNVLVVVPEDEAAACKYGRGTRWCTASTRGDNYFDAYNRTGKLYILIPKQPKYEGEKYQLHFDSKSFMDEDDSPTSLYDLLTNRFPELLEYFRKNEPELNALIPFMPDDALKEAVAAIAELGQQYADEVVQDWQDSDSSWFEYLKEKGYTDEEGYIDWDKVADADESYLEYNYEASNWLNKMFNALNLEPYEVRDIIDELIDNGTLREYPDIEELPEVIGGNIENKYARSREGDGGLGDHLTRNVILSGTPSGGYWARLTKNRR